MAYELEHCYRLLPGHYYWIPDLQESVAFKDPMGVRVKNFYHGQPCFGKLIRLGKGTGNTDIETDLDVEVGTDSLGDEIQVSDCPRNPQPLFYMEF